jgi:hypothetical protein
MSSAHEHGAGHPHDKHDALDLGEPDERRRTRNPQGPPDDEDFENPAEQDTGARRGTERPSGDGAVSAGAAPRTTSAPPPHHPVPCARHSPTSAQGERR